MNEISERSPTVNSRYSHARRLVWAMVLLAVLVVYKRPPTALPEDILSLINNAESIELYSLDAYTRDKDLEKFNAREMTATKFHGQTIYGSRRFTDEDHKSRIRKAIIDSAPVIENPFAAACFWPRHGVRFTAGDKHLDLVICFQCVNMQIYSPQREDSIQVTSAGKSVLNRILNAEGIPIEPER